MRLYSLVVASWLVACGPDEDDHHGTAHDLGTETAGPFEVSVTLYGEVEAGGSIALDVRLKGAPRAQSVSVRLADEEGNGSQNEPLPRVEGQALFHSHVPIPDGLPDDAALWVRVKGASGERYEARFSFR